MAIKYYLTKCNIKSSSNYGKYYARTLRGNEVTLADLMAQRRLGETIRDVERRLLVLGAGAPRARRQAIRT